MDDYYGPDKGLDTVFCALEAGNVSITQLLMALLTEKRYKGHPMLADLLRNAGTIITNLLGHRHLSDNARDQTCAVVERIYACEIKALVNANSGWHLGAGKMAPEDIEDFDWDEMGQSLMLVAPRIWSLLDVLLLARKRGNSLILDRSAMLVDGPDTDLENEHDRDEIMLEGNSVHSLNPTSTISRKQRLLNIKKVVIINIMMHSTNQKANTFQTIIGIFLHSTGTPQRAINALSHMGISIAQTTISAAINSLAANASEELRELGQTLLAAYAYDNFDIDLKHSVPTLEKSNQTLKHMTSGLLFPLQHGATKQDLACSDYLWQRSRLNPLNRTMTKEKTYHDLTLHLGDPPGTPSTHKTFNIWVFLRDLITHVEGFEYLHGELEDVKLLEPIPVKKTKILPAYSMDVNNSTTNGNIEAITQLMAQGGIGGPDGDETVDVSDYVVLVHGDLGTGKRIKSLMQRRSLERRPWERFQFVKFCPGLFHTKMACVDALWRIFIKPALAGKDETSLMKDIAVIRAKQTGSITSKCEFRRMHQIVQHVGAVRRLDCWRVALKKLLPSFTTLEDFAKSKPMLSELRTVAEQIVNDNVANHKIAAARRSPESKRDQQFENAAIMQQYFLLYEELTFAMNFGDVARLEKTLLPWILLFKAAGKHIYATEIEEFLLDTHFSCPEGLRRIIRYNMLVNPTGKSGKFRATDWCVELHNYYIKVKYGGQGSNRSVQRMISESALIGTYKLAQETIEKTLISTRSTLAHAEPDMRKTFSELRNSLSRCSPHEFVPGRKSKYCIPDMLNKGRELLHTKVGNGVVGEENGEEIIQPRLDDIIVELQ